MRGARRTERFPLGTRYAWLWLLNCILSNPPGAGRLGFAPSAHDSPLSSAGSAVARFSRVDYSASFRLAAALGFASFTSVCALHRSAACWSFSVPARSPDHVGAFFRNPRCCTNASSFHEWALVSRFPTTSGPRHPCGPCHHSQATRLQHLNSTSAPLCLGVSEDSPVRRPFLRFRFPPPKSRSAWRSVDVPIR